MESIKIDAGRVERRRVDCTMPELMVTIGDHSSLDLLVMCESYVGEQRIEARLGTHSTLTVTMLDMCNELIDRHVTVELEGEDARCELRSVALCRGSEQNSNYVLMKHLTKGCVSNQVFRSVASGESRIAFKGLIYVAKGAQKTEALQQSRNILLSDRAKVDTQPQLEIYADDVKCNHGAATGSFDENAIYYMRQRGIGLGAARSLLLEGFCLEVIDEKWLEQYPDISESLRKRLSEL